MTETFIRDILFPVIRAGLDVSTGPIPLTREDIAILNQIGDRQAILPVIYRGLKEQSIPAEWLQELEKGRLSYIYQYVLRDNSIKKLSAALEKTVVPYILLKGAVLRGLYPEAWMRTSSDLDILVQEETLDQAVSAIESNTDFRFDKRNYHDVRMLSSQLCLELHFSIKEHMDNIDKLLSRVWEYASPQEGTCRRELSPEFQAFHVLAHMSYHMAHGGLGIRPYLDLWLLKRKTSFDDGVVRRMCRECGILRFYEVSCDLLKVWMEGAAHKEITSVLERYCLNGRRIRQRRERRRTAKASRIFLYFLQTVCQPGSADGDVSKAGKTSLSVAGLSDTALAAASGREKTESRFCRGQAYAFDQSRDN